MIFIMKLWILLNLNILNLLLNYHLILILLIFNGYLNIVI